MTNESLVKSATAILIKDETSGISASFQINEAALASRLGLDLSIESHHDYFVVVKHCLEETLFKNITITEHRKEFVAKLKEQSAQVGNRLFDENLLCDLIVDVCEELIVLWRSSTRYHG